MGAGDGGRGRAKLTIHCHHQKRLRKCGKVELALKSVWTNTDRAQELCESRGGLPGFPPS